jgi:hypothetical protein
MLLQRLCLKLNLKGKTDGSLHVHRFRCITAVRSWVACAAVVRQMTCAQPAIASPGYQRTTNQTL